MIASVHTSFRMRAKEMTDRMVAAIEHPLVDAIGHPTGRKIERRPPYALDIERVIEAAARTGTMLEINAAPDRRDLDEIHAREAARAGVPILIDSDAHSTRNLRLLVATASTPRAAPGSRRSRSPTRGRGPSSESCANGNVHERTDPRAGGTRDVGRDEGRSEGPHQGGRGRASPDDQSLKNEGKVDRGTGKVKDAAGGVSDKVKDVVNPDRR